MPSTRLCILNLWLYLPFKTNNKIAGGFSSTPARNSPVPFWHSQMGVRSTKLSLVSLYHCGSHSFELLFLFDDKSGRFTVIPARRVSLATEYRVHFNRWKCKPWFLYSALSLLSARATRQDRLATAGFGFLSRVATSPTIFIVILILARLETLQNFSMNYPKKTHSKKGKGVGWTQGI